MRPTHEQLMQLLKAKLAEMDPTVIRRLMAREPISQEFPFGESDALIDLCGPLPSVAPAKLPPLLPISRRRFTSQRLDAPAPTQLNETKKQVVLRRSQPATAPVPPPPAAPLRHDPNEDTDLHLGPKVA